jgi:hypothetical protein
VDDGLEAELAAREGDDPLVRPATAGAALFQRVISTFADDRGVHLETVTVVLGALAGRACRLAAENDPSRERAVVETADGGVYVMGDAINWPLAESTTSVWALLAGAVLEVGGTLPDLGAAFAHSASTLGSPEFGVPRFAEGTNSAVSPAAALGYWGPASELITTVAPDPTHAPIAVGFALRDLVRAAAPGGADLEALARVALDAALTTSKLPLDD